MTSTSYRNIFLLALCQALLLTNAAALISMNGLVGYALVETKTIATLGATTYVLGSALSTMPMSLWMAQVGRRRGFMAGALINIGGCALAAAALYISSFPLYCVATAVIGIYNAVGLQYRFAATEVAAPGDKARAISLVLAGGIAGGFLGPAISGWGKDWFATPFLGSFVLLAAVALVALAVQSQVHVPKPAAIEQEGGGRPLRKILRQPVFIVAALSAGLGYGLMNLLMTATPLAMSFCSHPYTQAAFVIEWHVVGMYAPGFVTGSLIKRFGILNVILAGIAVMAAGAAVAAQRQYRGALRRRADLGRGRLEFHVHRRHDAAYRGASTRREGAHAGCERFHRVRDHGAVVVFVRRAGLGRRLGGDEPRACCRSSR